MVILAKKLKAGEVKWRGIVIPRKKKELFPFPGVVFDLSDGKNVYKVKMDTQYRIRLTEWFAKHRPIKAGDEVIFSKDNGAMHIGLNTIFRKTVSYKDLIGRETKEGKIVDIQQTPNGTVAIIQSTREVPMETILAEL